MGKRYIEGQDIKIFFKGSLENISFGNTNYKVKLRQDIN